MDKKILEVLNHILILLVYSFILFKNVKSLCFSVGDNVITLITIIISILLMFYLWSVKNVQSNS